MSGNIRQKYNDFSKTKHGNTHRLVHGNTIHVKILKECPNNRMLRLGLKYMQILELTIVKIVSGKIVNIIVMQDFHI